MCSLCAGRLGVATNERTRHGMTGTEHPGSPRCPTFADSSQEDRTEVRTVLEPGRAPVPFTLDRGAGGMVQTRVSFGGVAGVNARRAAPPDRKIPRWGLAGFRHLGPSHAARVTGEEIRLSSDRKSAHTTRVFGAETRHGARTPW